MGWIMDIVKIVTFPVVASYKVTKGGINAIKKARAPESQGKQSARAEIAKTKYMKRYQAMHTEGKPHWGTNPLSYPFQAIGGVPNVVKTGRFWDFGRGSKEMAPRIGGAVFTGIVGILAGAFIGSYVLSIAFGIWALSIILPGAAESQVITTRMGRELKLWKGRTASIFKAMAQMTALVLGMWALYTSNLPLSALVMLVIGFGGYMALPVTFSEGRTDDFIKSFIRMFLGVVVLSIWVFGNLFQSTILMFMGILFLAVPPIRRGDKTDVIRAGGEDMFYKIIFLVGMVMIFLMVTGLLPIWGTTGWNLGQTSMLVFYLIWGMSFLSGLFSAVEDIPRIGSILLIVALILFGTTGPGGDAIGMAMFGQWWPTVENSINNGLTPLGDMFSGLSNTFSSSFLMMTNPMGFATQIMDGGYSKNPDGFTGAYGLEIVNLQADVIYPGSPFTIRFELNNRGVREAEVEEVTILSSLNGFLFTDENGNRVQYIGTETDSETFQELHTWEYVMQNPNVSRSDVRPVFIIGEMDCDILKLLYFDYSSTQVSDLARKWLMEQEANTQSSVKKEASKTLQKGTEDRLKGAPDALKYITFRVRSKYKYTTDSAIPIRFVSDQRWRELSMDGSFKRSPVRSTITSGPVKLNLGTMDQPIPAGTPFFIGFNLTTSKRRTLIETGNVTLKFPFDIKDPAILEQKCSKKPQKIYSYIGSDGQIIYEALWEFGVRQDRSVFCYFDKGIFNMTGPEKTFTIEANSSYILTSWENYDTRTAFQSACFDDEYSKPGDNYDNEQELINSLDFDVVNTYYTNNKILANLTTGIDAICTTGCLNTNKGKLFKIEINNVDRPDQKLDTTTQRWTGSLEDNEGNFYTVRLEFTLRYVGNPTVEILAQNVLPAIDNNPLTPVVSAYDNQIALSALNLQVQSVNYDGENVIGILSTTKESKCTEGCQKIEMGHQHTVSWDQAVLPIGGNVDSQKRTLFIRDTDGSEFSIRVRYDLDSGGNPSIVIENQRCTKFVASQGDDDLVAGSTDIVIEPDYTVSKIYTTSTGYKLNIRYEMVSSVNVNVDQSDFKLLDSGGIQIASTARIPDSQGSIVGVSRFNIIFDDLSLTDGQEVTVEGEVIDSSNLNNVKQIKDKMRIDIPNMKIEKI